MHYDMGQLLQADIDEKPGGGQFDADSVQLQKFFEDTAQSEIVSFLKALGMGDRLNPHKLDVSMLRRIVEDQSVVYSTPPVRELSIDGVTLADDADEMLALNRVLDRMLYDVHWTTIDLLRNLYRQVAVVFTESNPHRCVQMRIFEPFNLRRKVDPSARDLLSADEAIAFQLSVNQDPEHDTFELWTHEDDGTWRAHVVNGGGELAGPQPYGDDGVSPFGTTAPFFMVYDELPRNRSYLPVNQNRRGFCLNSSALLNDICYLIKQEAHSTVVVAADDTRGLPQETGPGKIWSVPGDSSVQVLSASPKITESAQQLDRVLSYWAVAESLPADSFSEGKSILTGAALKVKLAPLVKRRRRQVPMVAPNEALAYEKLVVVHNTYASSWGLPMLPDDADLVATAADTWLPIDPKEMQEVYFKDIAVGAESLISYAQAKYGMTRTQAIEKYKRVQRDREAFPVYQQQNFAAISGGSTKVPGVESTKAEGAFNPEIETSTDSASITGAVQLTLDDGEPN